MYDLWFIQKKIDGWIEHRNSAAAVWFVHSFAIELLFGMREIPKTIFLCVFKNKHSNLNVLSDFCGDPSVCFQRTHILFPAEKVAKKFMWDAWDKQSQLWKQIMKVPLLGQAQIFQIGKSRLWTEMSWVCFLFLWRLSIWICQKRNLSLRIPCVPVERKHSGLFFAELLLWFKGSRGQVSRRSVEPECLVLHLLKDRSSLWLMWQQIQKLENSFCRIAFPPVRQYVVDWKIHIFRRD